MKALITGQNGFVGSRFTTFLDGRGDEVLPATDQADKPVDVTDADAVHDAIVGRGIDVVFHLAALTHVGDSWDAPARVWRVNTEGTMHVVHASARAGARVIVVSSADAYGSAATPVPLTEDVPLQPLSPYGASKAAAELIAAQAGRSSGADVVIARAFNHTGPGQPARFVVPALARRIVDAERNGVERIPVGNLDAVRDLSHVDDVIEAYRLLAEHGASGEIYNVCSGRPARIRDIAEYFISRAEQPLRLEVDPDLVRPIDVPYLIGDPAKLVSATAWSPAFDLDATLDAVLDAARRVG